MYPLFAKAPCTALRHHVRFTPASSDSNPRLVRKTFLQTILAVAISILAPMVAHADSATWDLNPTSGDWNTAANWTPMTVPNGPADVATFALSNTTGVSISANTEVDGIIFAPTATIPAIPSRSTPASTLTLSGTGIIGAQQFVACQHDVLDTLLETIRILRTALRRGPRYHSELRTLRRPFVF